MIVPMRHLDLVCLVNDRESTLERLRSLGVVHLELSSSAGETVGAAKGDLADAEKAVRLVLKARGKREMEVRSRSVAEVLAIEKDMDCLKAERERLERAIRIYAPYGDFDTALAEKLREKGIELLLLDDGKFDFVHTGDAAEQEKPAVRWPEMRLAKMEEKLARVENRIRIDVDRLAGCDEKDILRNFPSLRDRIDFEQAKGLLENHGAVSVISGWIPATREKELMDVVTSAGATELFDRVKSPGWGVLLRDAEPGENPPTLIEPPKLFRPVKALFAGLGIAPGYTEGDVSVPFMCYFSLFFAMLVGDGAYGAIFLVATLAMRKKLPAAWFTLLTVFSSATVAWGVLSNTCRKPDCHHPVAHRGTTGLGQDVSRERMDSRVRAVGF